MSSLAKAANVIPGALMSNGHLLLPECLAPDRELAMSMIMAGRAADVGAEVRRREEAKKSVGWYAPAVDLGRLAVGTSPTSEADSEDRRIAVEKILTNEPKSKLARTIRDVRRTFRGCTAHPRFNADLRAWMLAH